MAQTSKQGLSVINGVNFPNNNTGYITPERLREFNTDMIDSTVNQIEYDTAQASYNSFTASITASVEQLLNLSASLSGGYVTQGELADVTGSLIASINTKLNSSSFQTYTSSTDSRLINIESTTASLNTSISNINAFTSSVTPVATASLLITASYNGTSLTFTKGDASTFGIAGVQNTASFNSYTSSTNSRLSNVEIFTASVNSFTASTAISITNLNASSASQQVSINAISAGTASVNSFTASAQISITNLNSATASLQIETNNLELFTASAAGRLTNLESKSASVDVSITNLNASSASQQVSINAINTFTASTNSRLNAIESVSGSWITESETASFARTGANTFSGSQTITGSVYGNVVSMSIASSTASMDFSSGNFFTLTLANSTTTHIRPTNIRTGQTTNLLITQGTAGTASFSTDIKFPSGFSYSASSAAGAKDIITFITFADTASVFATSVKNLI